MQMSGERPDFSLRKERVCADKMDRELWKALYMNDNQQMTQEIAIAGYKIRDKNTGLFQLAGDRGWSKVGKTWSKLAHIKTHLKLHTERRHTWNTETCSWEPYSRKIPDSWEIVVLRYVVGDVFPVSDLNVQ